jgi:hypothetical protein
VRRLKYAARVFCDSSFVDAFKQFPIAGLNSCHYILFLQPLCERLRSLLCELHAVALLRLKQAENSKLKNSDLFASHTAQ